MKDQVLDRRLTDLKELVGLWNKFHEYLVLGVRGDSITPEKEREFLELKSRIAMLHDSFMESLTHDQKIGQNIITIISHCLTLRHLRRVSVAEIKKMEIEWHEAYLLLNETIGALEEKREILEKVPAIPYRTRKIVEGMREAVSSFLSSLYFKILIVVLALGFIIWGIPAFDIYDYSNLRNYKYTSQLFLAYEKFARSVFGADYPYDTIKEVTSKRDTGNRPGELRQQSVRTPVTKQEVITMVYSPPGLNIATGLMQSKEYQLERYTYQNAYLDLDIFLTSTIEDAENVVARFESWVQQTPQRIRLNYPYHLANVASVFRKLNLVFFVRSTMRQDLREEVVEIFKEEFHAVD